MKLTVERMHATIDQLIDVCCLFDLFCILRCCVCVASLFDLTTVRSSRRLKLRLRLVYYDI
jgi:hypothetical protein